jgi:hypothetical protein
MVLMIEETHTAKIRAGAARVADMEAELAEQQALAASAAVERDQLVRHRDAIGEGERRNLTLAAALQDAVERLERASHRGRELSSALARERVGLAELEGQLLPLDASIDDAADRAARIAEQIDVAMADIADLETRLTNLEADQAIGVELAPGEPGATREAVATRRALLRGLETAQERAAAVLEALRARRGEAERDQILADQAALVVRWEAAQGRAIAAAVQLADAGRELNALDEEDRALAVRVGGGYEGGRHNRRLETRIDRRFSDNELEQLVYIAHGLELHAPLRGGDAGRGQASD